MIGIGSHSPRDMSIPRLAVRREEAAAMIRVSVTKFMEWVNDGRMPKPHKFDGVVLWDVNEIREAWECLRDGTPRQENPFDGVIA
jgi:predicted DNA-binding transcriptional regulator AlpA